MTADPPPSRPFRFTTLCVLMALALRIVAPAVALPESSRWVALTLCRGAGPAPAVLDLKTGELREDGAPSAPTEEAAAHAPCLCAAAAVLAPPPAAVEVSDRVGAAPIAPAGKPDCTPGRGLAAPPPWSTGPPLTPL